MNKRVNFTQAQLARAIKAATAAGKLAVQTPAGIAFVDPTLLHQGIFAEPTNEENTCDGLFGKGR